MEKRLLTVDEYIAQVDAPRREVVGRLRQIFLENLPDGFEETISYGMIGYVVPHSIYPKGYHCDTKLPLPFLSLAAQKTAISVYHMGIYADANLYNWLETEYENWNKTQPKPRKIDIGKSCIRFKNVEQIPFDLFRELAQKMTCETWILTYEKAFLKK